MMGLFGDLFDFNHDGKLDGLEQVAEFATFAAMMEHSDSNQDKDETELEMAGLDPSELEFMDADERREVLEDAGLEPDEFDF